MLQCLRTYAGADVSYLTAKRLIRPVRLRGEVPKKP